MKVRLDSGAKQPTRAYPTDAGLDLRSMHDVVLPPHGHAKVHTGVHVQLPPYTAGIIISKSGLNVNHDITSSGLIDEGYTGEIVVKLYNHGDEHYTIHAGDKISQLVVVPVLYVETEVVDELQAGERGDNGFGSSGR